MPLSRIKQFSILFSFIMIIWAIVPFFNFGGMSFSSDSIGSSIILILVGIAYPLIIFNPQWNKAVLLIEGIIFAFVGFTFLNPFYDVLFLIIGIFCVVLALLAYVKKLPLGLLKFFYKSFR